VLSVDADLKMTLLGTVSLGSNDVNSVAVKDGLVAVAVAELPSAIFGHVCRSVLVFYVRNCTATYSTESILRFP
jgi:hypothetical protein